MRFLVWPVSPTNQDVLINLDNIREIYPWTSDANSSPPQPVTRFFLRDGKYIDIAKSFADVVTIIQNAEP